MLALQGVAGAGDSREGGGVRARATMEGLPVWADDAPGFSSLKSRQTTKGGQRGD